MGGCVGRIWESRNQDENILNKKIFSIETEKEVHRLRKSTN